MSKWQPIVTAPRNGTKILIWDNDCIIAYYREDAELGGFKTGAGWQIIECEDNWYSEIASNPTYWMPLPEPPREDK